MRIGFVYNVRRREDDEVATDDEAEFDDPAAIFAIRAAIAAGGHEVIDFEADARLPQALAASPVDAVFNIAEGSGPRSREAQVPALLDLLGIPYTGSDAVTLGITLDKSLAKTLVAAAGVATPRGFLVVSGDEPVLHGLRLSGRRQAGARGLVEGDHERLRRRGRGEPAPPGAGRGRALRPAGALRGIRRRP